MKEAHSSLEAATVVCSILSLLGGPWLWWVFFRMGEDKNYDQPTGVIDETPMSDADIECVERELSLAMPESLKSFVQRERNSDEIDYETVAGSANGFIEMTREYRAGFVGMPKWPHEWLYFGDDGTACPYAIDCTTGEVLHLDHGNPKSRKLGSWPTFDVFLAEQREIAKEAEESCRGQDPEEKDWIPIWMYSWKGAVACMAALLCTAGCVIGVARLLNKI
jgi:hypothetical protein